MPPTVRWARAHRRLLAMLVIGLVAIVAVGPLQLTDGYQNFVITTIAIYAIITLSVTELAGLGGIWSVGHMAFVAIGAYSTAYFSNHGVPLPLILLFAVVAAAALGFVIGLTAGRFEVLYLAILTLALALVAGEVIGRWTSVTGGELGEGVAPTNLFGLGLHTSTLTGVAIGAATLIFILVDLVARGRYGRRWLAVKNQKTAAVAIGLNPPMENATAFAGSAALTSVAGILLALQVGYISAPTFNLTNGINFIVASVVGGVGSIVGALVGTAFIVVVPQAAQGAKDFQVILFGALTIAVLLFLPEGVAPGVVRRASRWLARGRRPETTAGVTDATSHADAMEALIRPRLPQREGAGEGHGHELVMERVGVRFGGLAALEEVKLDVRPGEVVALIGPNGAGKTTLLNVLGGYVKPTPGSVVRFGSHDLLRLPAPRRARIGIGRTFQHAELFSELTVLDSIALAALRRHDSGGRSPHELASEMLQALGLARYADETPSSLPFGIQKRVDIVRALAMGPSLIVMDEPFSGLDLNEQDELHDLVLAFRRTGISVLLVDHAVQQVLSLADDVFVLDYGRIIAHGTPQEIRGSEAVKEAYFGTAEVSA